ncbi:uncharacterized protein CMU_034170 [Cryptosporidium muris RN66]|uniref:Uncharacterized protein n=1 Tax=Cryptosporidium muris (strain RN66) TaxID=441375 RepID=B6AFP0_CRYMR|nr:uncharacterized protein CMU_034170 [Cryptosporidium muris RN66]EEA07031.1 hypothetical protein, conserved [Cryptosporidium muris RN66]|eukprot:XP_002141380.1 hypothetical protein [Cryptosporidium muris RN66]
MKTTSELGLDTDKQNISKKLCTNTIDTIFKCYWTTPEDLGYQFRVHRSLKNSKDLSQIEVDNTSEASIFNEKSKSRESETNDMPLGYSLYGIKDELSQYLPRSLLLTRTKPIKWPLNIEELVIETDASSLNFKDVSSRKLETSQTARDSGLNEDVDLSQLQSMWHNCTSQNSNYSGELKKKASILVDTNDSSPIYFNFPHPIQLQNSSLPYDVLDPRSVPVGTFVWWDRKIWEFNMVHIAKRLSIKKLKTGKENKISSRNKINETEPETKSQGIASKKSQKKKRKVLL